MKSGTRARRRIRSGPLLPLSAAIVCALLPVSAGLRAEAEQPLAAVAWLAGCWQPDGDGPGSVEHWLAPAGGTMLGISRTVRDGRTVQFEFMQFRQDEAGVLQFIAKPSGQDETVFALVESSRTRVSFAAPTHDFPQRVTYELLSVQRMRGRIEGLLEGRSRAIDFPFTRVACDRTPSTRD